MKKFTAALLVLSIVFLCGCAAKLPQSPPETSEPTTESATVRVSFPEGFSAVQIARRLEKNNVCKAEDFMAQVNELESASEIYSFAAEIKNADERAFALEGYIFPDTYDFYKGESASSALSRFLKNADDKLSDDYYTRAEQLGYTMDEIVVLASIIQKEAGKKSEMAKVSSVLHNRLESPDYGRLQCDVTINYVNDYITNSPYLDSDTSKFAGLYNTYKRAGLPSGAICNPGLDAIQAALYPEDTNYFFFVTDENDNYFYAQTYEEHLKNCRDCGLL